MMEQATALNTIDLDAMPKWDYSVRVRGMEIPMISPLDAPEMNEAPMPTQAQLDAKTKRWPGLFVWLWRMIIGGPRIDAGDLPGDGGAAHTRMICTIILGEEFEELVSELRHAECVLVFSTYMAAQHEWIDSCGRYARERVSEHIRRQHGEPAVSGTPASKPSGSGLNRGGQVQLVPGDPYPFQASYHPKLYNKDGSKRE